MTLGGKALRTHAVAKRRGSHHHHHRAKGGPLRPLISVCHRSGYFGPSAVRAVRHVCPSAQHTRSEQLGSLDHAGQGAPACPSYDRERLSGRYSQIHESTACACSALRKASKARAIRTDVPNGALHGSGPAPRPQLRRSGREARICSGPGRARTKHFSGRA